MPTVSVVIPTYNRASFLGQAIESVLSQTRVPEEVIVVNDGSTDDTSEVVQKYRDPRIVYVEQVNKGVSSARNRGMSLAGGDYIAFLDSDDLWRPTMVEKQLAILEGEPSAVCSFTNFGRFDEQSGREMVDQFRYYPLSSLSTTQGPVKDSFVIVGDAFCGLAGFHSTPCFMPMTMLRAKSVAGLRFNEGRRIAEDYEFMLRVYLLGRVAYTREILADVRRHASNISKDYELGPVLVLDALRAIEGALSTQEQVVVYRDRLVKAHVDAAVVHVKRDRFAVGMSVFSQGLVVPGSSKRKVKGLMRIAWEAVRRVFASRQ